MARAAKPLVPKTVWMILTMAKVTQPKVMQETGMPR
jgi:hypothetical protein